MMPEPDGDERLRRRARARDRAGLGLVVFFVSVVALAEKAAPWNLIGTAIGVALVALGASGLRRDPP